MHQSYSNIQQDVSHNTLNIQSINSSTQGTTIQQNNVFQTQSLSTSSFPQPFSYQYHLETPNINGNTSNFLNTQASISVLGNDHPQTKNLQNSTIQISQQRLQMNVHQQQQNPIMNIQQQQNPMMNVQQQQNPIMNILQNTQQQKNPMMNILQNTQQQHNPMMNVLQNNQQQQNSMMNVLQNNQQQQNPTMDVIQNSHYQQDKNPIIYKLQPNQQHSIHNPMMNMLQNSQQLPQQNQMINALQGNNQHQSFIHNALMPQVHQHPGNQQRKSLSIQGQNQITYLPYQSSDPPLNNISHQYQQHVDIQSQHQRMNTNQGYPPNLQFNNNPNYLPYIPSQNHASPHPHTLNPHEIQQHIQHNNSQNPVPRIVNFVALPTKGEEKDTRKDDVKVFDPYAE